MKNKALDLWFDIIHHGEEKELNNQYLGLVKEECKELEMSIVQLESAFLLYLDGKISKEKFNEYYYNFRKEQMDAIVVIQGWYKKAGLSLEEDMNKVCESNMSKIYEDQQEALKDFKNVQEKYKVKCFIKPTIIGDKVYYTIRRTEDGKILKPTKYKEAEI